MDFGDFGSKVSSYIINPTVVPGLGGRARYSFFYPLSRDSRIVAATELESSNTAPTVTLGTTPSTYSSFESVIQHQSDSSHPINTEEAKRSVPSHSVKTFGEDEFQALKSEALSADKEKETSSSVQSPVKPPAVSPVKVSKAVKRSKSGNSSHRVKKFASSGFDLA